MNFASSLADFFRLITDGFQIAGYLVSGIYDRGKSYKNLLDLLDKDVQLYDWISPESK